MMSDDEPCPLCDNDHAELVKTEAETTRRSWKCQYCGSFIVSWPRTDEGLRELSGRSILRGLATERRLREDGPLRITMENLEQLLEQGPQNPAEQADRLLLNLARVSSEPGIATNLTSNRHRGLAFADATDAFVAWLAFLAEEGMIETWGKRQDSPNDLVFRLKLAGWRRVAELERRGWQQEVGFVAMPFSPDYDALWDRAIKPAITEAGWRAVRADKTDHNQRIDDWIMNQIRGARFAIVDTTGSNPGACFEAGYALGLGKPVIWTAADESLEDGLHFDIRQYNHLPWTPEAEDELRKPLVARILNTVGQGSQ